MPDTANPRSGEPQAPAPIVVCADDFGRDAATSAVIRTLIEGRRINATTCLVETREWPAEARSLRDLADAGPGAAVGLHLNLTEPLANAADPRTVAPIGVHIARALAPASPAYEDAVHAAFRAQWDAFVRGLGRTPDFIDGHEHVHLFPAPGRALFRLAAEVGFDGWLRQCATSSARPNVKRLILDPFSHSFRRGARARGLADNPGFGGLRRFAPGEDMERLWRADLVAMRQGGVLMVHPGARDGGRAGLCRDQEARLIADGALAAVMDDLGLALAADAARPWRG
jgi:chitin disaccharide deacetylase